MLTEKKIQKSICVQMSNRNTTYRPSLHTQHPVNRQDVKSIACIIYVFRLWYFLLGKIDYTWFAIYDTNMHMLRKRGLYIINFCFISRFHLLYIYATTKQTVNCELWLQTKRLRIITFDLSKCQACDGAEPVCLSRGPVYNAAQTTAFLIFIRIKWRIARATWLSYTSMHTMSMNL